MMENSSSTARSSGSTDLRPRRQRRRAAAAQLDETMLPLGSLTADMTRLATTLCRLAAEILAAEGTLEILDPSHEPLMFRLRPRPRPHGRAAVPLKVPEAASEQPPLEFPTRSHEHI